MDSTYSRAVSYAVPVFVALILFELAADRARGTRYYRLADAINSMSCGVVSTGGRVFVAFIGIFAYEWVLARTPARLDSASWTTWIFAFVLYDFCYYWFHRLSHRVGVLWASHVVHHQSEEFNLTTALRQPATSSFLAWVFYLPMALCGVPLSVFLLVGVAQLFYQFWPHTRIIGRLGILDRWIQTPSNHRVHHAQNAIYLDRNYVGVFLIWDRIFGTWQDELDSEPCLYGIRGQLRSWNPVWANVHYYWVMVRDSWQAPNWRHKLRIWFGPPGYGKTLPSLDGFTLYDPPRRTSLSLYALLQFASIAAANSHFLMLLNRQPPLWNFLYFVAILISLVIVGGVLESRRSFLVLDILRHAAITLASVTVSFWLPAVFSLISAVWVLLELPKSTHASQEASRSARDVRKGVQHA